MIRIQALFGWGGIEGNFQERGDLGICMRMCDAVLVVNETNV